MRVFAKAEWRKYDSRDSITCIFCTGNVYDISHIFHCKKGIHQVPHYTERGLTNDLNKPRIGLICLKFSVVSELLDLD